MATDVLIDLLRGSAPERPAGARMHVAFSGGMDSTVLLHALVRAGLPDVVAVHVHHGLQAHADDWALHCRTICTGLGVPLREQRVRIEEDGRGLEAAAREARYAALRSEMGPGEVLATAHHLGDQAETLLLNLVRGSGSTGLGAMSVLSEFRPGRLWRPLLQVPRDELQAYAERNRLRWIEDPHNGDPRFARSHLRAEILPRLKQRWPGVEENLARTATLASESAGLLRELALADLAAIAGADDRSLPINALLAMSGARRGNLVRAWIEKLGLPLPGYETLRHLERQVLVAARDATPVLAWPGGQFRRHRDRLFAMSVLPPVPDGFHAQWDGSVALVLPDGCGELSTQSRSTRPWTVRLASPSDRFRLRSGGRSRTLKNLFQECGVPTWVRERTPLLALDERPVWVGGLGWIAEDGSHTASAAGDVEWRHRLPGAVWLSSRPASSIHDSH
jgi:tRNA(Ile)-lysidine synthase